MDFRLAAVKALAAFRREGLISAARKAGWHLLPSRPVADLFDLHLGTNTSGIVPPWRLGLQSVNVAHAVQYEPTPPDEIREAVKFAGVVPSQHTFVDIGCGKGRVLIIGAQLGFRRVIGVEFSPSLAAIAKANLTKLAIRNSEIPIEDAANYKFPDEDLVVYLFNPFSREVMKAVVANLQPISARVACIIYKRPNCADLLDGLSFVQRLGSPPENPDILVWTRRHGAR